MQAHTGYTLCLVHEHGHKKRLETSGAKIISRIGIEVRKLCKSDFTDPFNALVRSTLAKPLDLCTLSLRFLFPLFKLDQNNKIAILNLMHTS